MDQSSQEETCVNVHSTTFVCALTYLCRKPEGTCFQVFIKNCRFGLIFSYSQVSRLLIEKHEYIDVNSKIYIVNTSKRTRNESETESARNKEPDF